MFQVWEEGSSQERSLLPERLDLFLLVHTTPVQAVIAKEGEATRTEAENQEIKGLNLHTTKQCLCGGVFTETSEKHLVAIHKAKVQLSE